MVFGQARVSGKMLITRKGSYFISNPEGFTNPQPFLWPTAFIVAGFLIWTLSFSDLLKPIEIISILAGACVALLAGWHIGQLRFESRALNSGGASVVAWGTFGGVRKLRAEIEAQFSDSTRE